MSTKHSPGPWEVVGGHYPSFKEVKGPSFKVSAVMWAADLTEDDYQQRIADLDLVASAPGLLSIARRWAALNGGEWNIERHASEKAELLADTRAAISTATGAA